MFIPRLPRRRLDRENGRARGNSVTWICVLGLLCLFGVAQAGETSPDRPDKPGIGLKKSLDGVTANSDGTYTCLLYTSDAADDRRGV